MMLRAGRLVLLVWCALAGCDRSVSSSRDRLTAQQAGWQRSLQTLEQQQAALAGRFGGSAANASPNSGALQIRAVLDGAQQSLRDIDVQIQQSTARFDRSVANGVAGEQAAEAERIRLEAYLQAMSEQLAAADRTLGSFEQHRTEVAR